MSYHAEMERLLADYELRLRKEIAAFETLERSDRSEKGMTDHLLETLRSSAIASSSREVERARGAPESPDRRRIAMKWAKAAADEAAFMTELHRRWRLDYEHGREAHHITADEVKPFAIPKDGPGADAPSRQGERNK